MVLPARPKVAQDLLIRVGVRNPLLKLPVDIMKEIRRMLVRAYWQAAIVQIKIMRDAVSLWQAISGGYVGAYASDSSDSEEEDVLGWLTTSFG